MNTPFVFEKTVSGEAFTDREKETAKLVSNFQYGVNTFIVSPRRWGKTSLVKKVKGLVENEKLKIVYMDVQQCRCREDFCERLASAVLSQTATKVNEWLYEMSLKINLSPKERSMEDLLITRKSWIRITYLRRFNFMGNVSIYGKSDYLNRYSRFALFLRGFEEDNYSRRVKKSNRSKMLSGFSEYWFVYVLQKRIHACAIGMTKETDSPYGARRIYVNDKVWKEDVNDLIERAERIYIHVNDRPSCIWEIGQTNAFKQKTMFIVDSVEKYNKIKLMLADTIDLPDIPDELLKENDCYFIVYENNQFVVSPYENTIEGYCKLLDYDEELIQKKIRITERTETGWKVVGKLLLVYVLMMFCVVSVSPFSIATQVLNSIIISVMFWLITMYVLIEQLVKLFKS